MKKKQSTTKFTFSNIVFFTMLGLLAISVIAEIFIPTYKTNPLLYTTFGVIAGFVFKNVK